MSDHPKILATIHGTAIKERRLPLLSYQPYLKGFARQNRKAGYLCEVLFWKQVRAKSFYGLSFVRQQMIDNYIVDFYCRALGLAVEIDGRIHEHQVEHDSLRQAQLEKLGVRFFRVTNEDILYNMQWVMNQLEDYMVENFR